MANPVSLDDFSKALAEETTPEVSKAIVKLNGICYCSECKVKLNAVREALIKMKEVNNARRIVISLE